MVLQGDLRLMKISCGGVSVSTNCFIGFWSSDGNFEIENYEVTMWGPLVYQFFIKVNLEL